MPPGRPRRDGINLPHSSPPSGLPAPRGCPPSALGELPAGPSLPPEVRRRRAAGLRGGPAAGATSEGVRNCAGPRPGPARSGGARPPRPPPSRLRGSSRPCSASGPRGDGGSAPSVPVFFLHVAGAVIREGSAAAPLRPPLPAACAVRLRGRPPPGAASRWPRTRARGARGAPSPPPSLRLSPLPSPRPGPPTGSEGTGAGTRLGSRPPAGTG